MDVGLLSPASPVARRSPGSGDCGRGCDALVDRLVLRIDQMVSAQVDAILHHPRFQALEASWRGLRWLIDEIEPSPRLHVRVLTIAWNEVCRDLDRAAEFDQSLLFRKIYEEEFGIAGGEPYGVMLVDRAIAHVPSREAPQDDVAALASLAGIAAAAFCPMIFAASPKLLGVDAFDELGPVLDPAAALRDEPHDRFRSLSAREDSRFVALLLPRLLGRPAWTDDPHRRDGWRYREFAPTTAERVWMPPIYAFGAVVARAFARFGWPADVRGSEVGVSGGGVVEGLPTEPFSTEPGTAWFRHPLEIVFTDAQERSLTDAGLMPLAALPFGPEPVFGTVRSLQVPPRYTGSTSEAASANSRLSAQINSMLCASRFAHYVKTMGRDLVGAARTASDIEMRLQRWLQGYVNARSGGALETRARFPLTDARVKVSERPGEPGVYGCTIHLKPHHQLDDVSASFQLITEIAGAPR